MRHIQVCSVYDEQLNLAMNCTELLSNIEDTSRKNRHIYGSTTNVISEDDWVKMKQWLLYLQVKWQEQS